MTAARLASVSANPPDAADARSTNSSTDSLRRSSSSGSAGRSARQLQRRDWQEVLAGHRERLAAGGDHPHARRHPDDVGHQRGGRIEQVLAVVDQEEQLLVLQVGEQDGSRAGRRLIAQIQRGEDGVLDETRVPDVGQLHEPRATRERARKLGGAPDRQSRLPDTTRADEGDQAGRGELRPKLRELAATADEAGRLGREIAGTTDGPGHG